MQKNLDVLLFESEIFLDELSATDAYTKLAENRGEVAKHFNENSECGDISGILEDETKYVQFDLLKFANTPLEVASLEGAIEDLDAMKRGVANVSDSSKYREFAEEYYGHPKSRRGGLPYDEARRSFDAHSMRLQTLLKARLDAGHKEIIRARYEAITNARTLYIDAQKHALGLTHEHDASQTNKQHHQLQQVLIDPTGEYAGIECLVNLSPEEAELARSAPRTLVDIMNRGVTTEVFKSLGDNFVEASSQSITASFRLAHEEGREEVLRTMVGLYQKDSEWFVEAVLWNAGVRFQAHLTDESDTKGAVVLPEGCEEFLKDINERVAEKIKEITLDADCSQRLC